MSGRSPKYPRSEILKILREAELSGNISNVCHEYGISRSWFYSLRKRFREEGEEGIQIRSSSPGTPAKKVNPSVLDVVQRLIEADPYVSSRKVVRLIADQGIDLSHTTVNQIRKGLGLGTKPELQNYVERKVFVGDFDRNNRIVKKAEDRNPRLSERFLAPKFPGELLLFFQFTENLLGNENIEFQVLLDTFSGFAISGIGEIPKPEDAVEFISKLLKDEIFHSESTLALIIDNRWKPHSLEFWDLKESLSKVEIEVEEQRFSYSLPQTVSLNIRLGTLPPVTLRRNGYVRAFHNEFVSKFLPRARLVQEESSLIEELEQWTDEYNQTEQFGFPSFGLSPIDRLRHFSRHAKADGERRLFRVF